LNLDTEIRSLADRCVACGLCLPLCPTYRKTRNEAESPRGRIALMRALANGELALTTGLISHLELCLACGACEKACPSHVAYGRLINASRASILFNHPLPFYQRWAHHIALGILTGETSALRGIGKFLRFCQQSGLLWLLRIAGALRLLGIAKLEAELPPIRRQVPWLPFYPSYGESRSDVALFTGCVANITDRETLEATIRVLNHFGYSVHVPPDQGCCGALHQHGGEPDKARSLMRRNIHAFPAGEMDAIITTASGCAATLGGYGQLLEDEAPARTFSSRIFDISQFLVGNTWPEHVSLNPLKKRIAVHDPCTLVNALRQPDKPYELLNKIPGAEIIPLPENNLCCGAAGAYHLRQPEMAESLRADKIEHLKRLGPDILATSNVGCAMYLAAGIREAGLDVEVLHPIVLLERQLQTTSYK